CRRGRGRGLRGGLRQDHGGGGGGDDGDQRGRADLGAQRAHAGRIVHRLIYSAGGRGACGGVSATSTGAGRKGCASPGNGCRLPYPTLKAPPALGSSARGQGRVTMGAAASGVNGLAPATATCGCGSAGSTRATRVVAARWACPREPDKRRAAARRGTSA